jgi:hypothetical protein
MPCSTGRRTCRYNGSAELRSISARVLGNPSSPAASTSATDPAGAPSPWPSQYAGPDGNSPEVERLGRGDGRQAVCFSDGGGREPTADGERPSGRGGAAQHRVVVEVAWVGDRPLMPDDLPHLSYWVQVLRSSGANVAALKSGLARRTDSESLESRWADRAVHRIAGGR